jgi:hypothetical protein
MEKLSPPTELDRLMSPTLVNKVKTGGVSLKLIILR